MFDSARLAPQRFAPTPVPCYRRHQVGAEGSTKTTRRGRYLSSQSTGLRHWRQRGLILAFDVAEAGAGFSERFHLAARRHGLLIRPIGATVYLMPPYLIDDESAAFLARAVAAALDDVTAKD